jgi:competence protein ComEC
VAIVYLAIAWFIGLWLAAQVMVGATTWLIGAGVALVAALLFRHHSVTRPLLICAFTLCLAGARYEFAVPRIEPSHIGFYNGAGTVTLTGLVGDEPDVRDQYVNLRLEVETITLPQGEVRAVQGSVLLRADRFPVIPYGARIQAVGLLTAPPTGQTFNYREYLARQGIHSYMERPQVTVLAYGEGHPLYQAIYALKARASTTINRLVREPEASLLNGILLGADRGIPADLLDDFRATGTSHIIAVSGFNVTILAATLIGVIEPILGRRWATRLALIGIGLYAILTGAEAAVMRAAIMGGLYIIGRRALGRPTYMPASLFTAGLVMTLLNPFMLWDIGFQLSFAATLGLMLYAEPLGDWLQTGLRRVAAQSVTNKLVRLLSDTVVPSIAALILVQPLILFYFGQVSFISLLANLLILPAQPAVMIWGGLAAFTGMVIPALGQLFAWATWLLLTYTITMVRILADVPGATTAVPLSAAGVVAIYAVIFVLTWFAKQRPTRWAAFRAMSQHQWQQAGQVTVTISLIVAALTFYWGVSQPDGYLHVAFLDVGQGDAIFIESPTGRQILVDGGLYPNIINEQLGRQMAFWDREIDMVVATHPDADHVTGLPGVLDRYQVNRLVCNGQESNATAYQALLAAAARQQTPVHIAVAGEVIELGDGVRLEVLHPNGILDNENDNENSVSFRLVYGNFTLLLTGDAESEAEQAMLANGYSLSAVVLKAGHHGSNTSSTAPFLAAVRPQVMVVSVGEDNNYGLPHPEMLQRANTMGVPVLRTDELGTIEVVTDGERMWWQARR